MADVERLARDWFQRMNAQQSVRSDQFLVPELGLATVFALGPARGPGSKARMKR